MNLEDRVKNRYEISKILLDLWYKVANLIKNNSDITKHFTDPNAHDELFSNKVDNTDFNNHTIDPNAHKELFNIVDLALLAKQDSAEKGLPDGYVPLDSTTKIPPVFIPIVTDFSLGGAETVLSAEAGVQLKNSIDVLNNDLQNKTTIVNVGVGARIYKGVGVNDRKEFKSISTAGNLLNHTTTEEEIVISLDESKIAVPTLHKVLESGNTSDLNMVVGDIDGQYITPKYIVDGENNTGYPNNFLCVVSDVTNGSKLKWVDLPLPDLSGKADLVNGLVPASQLPSFVDDVLEFQDFASFPVTGESGVLYLALDTNEIYRWSGSTYVNMSSSNPTIPSLQDVVNVGNNADLINVRDLGIGANLVMGQSKIRDRLGLTGQANQILRSTNLGSVEWQDLPVIPQDLYKSLEFISAGTTILDIGFAQKPKLIFINSALLVSADWSFSDTTVTFTFAPDLGAIIQII